MRSRHLEFAHGACRCMSHVRAALPRIVSGSGCTGVDETGHQAGLLP